MSTSKGITSNILINLEIQSSLLNIRDRFLDLVASGSASLDAWTHDFSLLQQQIAARQKSLSLDEETLQLSGTVATTVLIIGQGLVDFESVASSHLSHLKVETDAMVDELFQERSSVQHTPSSHPHRMPKPSLQSPRYPTTPITSALVTLLPPRNASGTASVTESSRSASDPSPPPEFIEHAYKFFLANIFNPYPTREEKQAIVNETNNSRVTVTTVSNWFSNARRRCGWVDILKERCNDNRDELIDLAKRVFVKPDPRHPVDPQIVTELMEMKEIAESMYEDNTRTSAWIDELEEMEELINPLPEVERRAAKKRETDAERDLRKRQKEVLKEQRDFERRKRKMQGEALRKAERVARNVQHGQGKEKKASNKAQCSRSSVMSDPPTEQDDEKSIMDPSPAAGGKRKLYPDDGDSYDSGDLRHVSPAFSLSSSLNSDLSSDGRVPSLSWSDSGDERPYKRSRSSSSTPYTNTSSLAPALEITTSFDYSFTFEPPTGLNEDSTVFNAIFDFPVNTGGNHVATPQAPPRGQKRLHDLKEEEEEGEPTPQAKRAKPIVASSGPELPPVPSTPLFTPTPSINGTPTVTLSRRSSFEPVDVDAVLGLEHANLPPMHDSQQDTSLPLDIGVFDWSSCVNPVLDPLSGSVTGVSPADYAQLFQLFTEDAPSSHVEAPKPSEQRVDTQLLPSLFEVPASDFLIQNPASTTNSDSHLVADQSVDLSGLMSTLMSEEAYNDLGLNFPDTTPSSSRDLSRSSSSVSLAWTSTPTTLPETTPTPAELAEKLLSKERKRREIEEKKAALERERARLAELERELEDE